MRAFRGREAVTPRVARPEMAETGHGGHVDEMRVLRVRADGFPRAQGRRDWVFRAAPAREAFIQGRWCPGLTSQRIQVEDGVLTQSARTSQARKGDSVET